MCGVIVITMAQGNCIQTWRISKTAGRNKTNRDIGRMVWGEQSILKKQCSPYIQVLCSSGNRESKPSYACSTNIPSGVIHWCVQYTAYIRPRQAVPTVGWTAKEGQKLNVLVVDREHLGSPHLVTHLFLRVPDDHGLLQGECRLLAGLLECVVAA